MTIEGKLLDRNIDPRDINIAHGESLSIQISDGTDVHMADMVLEERSTGGNITITSLRTQRAKFSGSYVLVDERGFGQIIKTNITLLKDKSVNLSGLNWNLNLSHKSK